MYVGVVHVLDFSMAWLTTTYYVVLHTYYKGLDVMNGTQPAVAYIAGGSRVIILLYLIYYQTETEAEAGLPAFCVSSYF